MSNVDEWTLDAFANYGNPCTDCAFASPGQMPNYLMVAVGGGDYIDYASHLLPGFHPEVGAVTRSTSFGFRCARTP